MSSSRNRNRRPIFPSDRYLARRPAEARRHEQEMRDLAFARSLEMQQHQGVPSGDNSNQPSTSRVMPNSPVRVGVPDPTWGDCTMCFEVPIRPQGCNRCHQIIGCAECVLTWYNSAKPAASCPLCRNKWDGKAEVTAMSEIADK